MLNTDLFVAFLAATTALILLPGPIVTLVIANAIAHGTRTGLSTVAGSSVGNALLVAAGALGLSTVLVLISDLFEVLRWAGVAYLVWLGLRAWREALRRGANPEDAAMSPPAPAGRNVFVQGMVVAVTNPKTIFFYVAFFPQFLDPSLPAGPQLAVMSAAMVAIAVTFDSCYALIAGRVRPWLVGRTRTRIRHGITGTLLIGTGVGLALARR
jgi:threonine/homoserine/homoserine lactone efflux protein